MSVSFECPSCQRKLKAPEKLIGKRLQCPSCFNEVTVPEGSYEDAYPVTDSPMPGRMRTSNSPSTRSSARQDEKARPEPFQNGAWYRKVSFIAPASGFVGFLLGVLSMWLMSSNGDTKENAVTRLEPASSLATGVSEQSGTTSASASSSTSAEISNPTGKPSPKAASVQVPSEPGYGNDLPKVIESALKDLESGQVRQFVLRIFPPEAIADMATGPPGKTRLDSINPDGTLIIRMREDLKALRSITPEIKGGTAEYIVPPQIYSAKESVMIRPNPNGLAPPDRVIRFSLLEGHWRFFAGARPKSSGNEK